MNHHHVAKIFFVAIVIAAILNGSSFWLKRVGWLEPQLYETYQREIHRAPGNVRTVSENEELRAFTSRVYQVEGWQLLSKAAKDLVMVLFIAASIAMVVKFHLVPGLKGYWPAMAFMAMVLLSGIQSAARADPILALAGFRGFLFLLVALFGAWAAKETDLEFLARCFVVFLLIQLLITPMEMATGMHLFKSSGYGLGLDNRIVGTMLQPVSLGVFTVSLWSFCYGVFKPSGPRFWALGALVATLVFASGSATAVLLLALLIGFIVDMGVEQNQRKWLRAFGLLGGGALLFLLPWLVRRPDIYDSLWGRISLFAQHAFTDSGIFVTLLGRGLGTGTNTAANIFMDWQQNEAIRYGVEYVFISDSTPLAMVAQLGLVGLLLFYLLLAFAARRDYRMRPFYLVVAMASLTVNITELFPVNFLLGLSLARSLAAEDKVIN